MACVGGCQGFTTKICLVLAIISTIRAEPSGHKHSQQCPDVNFLPDIPTPSKCISSHHCTKVECVAAAEGHKLTAIFKLHRCKRPMTATVTLEQPENSLNWSHTFRDGEKAKLPTTASSFTGGLQVSDSDLFVQVKLGKIQGNSVKFTVSIVGHVTISEQDNPVDVTLMEGESPVSTVDCMRNLTIESLAERSEKADSYQGNDYQENCPTVKLPEGSNGTCVLSGDCSKVTCTSPDSEDKGPFGHMVLTVQAHGCRQPLKATVTMESSLTPEKWSHTFEDGDKAALPMPPGGPEHMKMFLKVELKRNGDKVHFKLVLLMESNAASYNTTLLKGELLVSKCMSHRNTESPTESPTEHSDRDNHPQNCPAVKLPDGSKGTCVLSEDCSKVTCTSPDSDDKGPFGGHMVLTVQAHGCRQPLKATVTIETSLTPEKWSHTYEDGDKAAWPMAPGGPEHMKVFLKVELKKNGDKVHFKLVMLMESNGVAAYNVTFLKGELNSPKCDDHSKQCPVVNFLPGDPTPHKCSFSDHCSKVECITASEGHKMTVTFKLNQCQQPLTGTVSILLQSPGHIDWSHTLQDGEKAKLPATPSSFTGDLPVSDASLFIQVKLRKTQGNNVNFTVALVGEVTDPDEAKPHPVNVVLLQGEMPAASTKNCGSSASWFSRQSGGVKAVVIIIPVTMVILLGLVVGLCCYRSRRDGLRFPVNIFQNRSNVGMQRLSNEL